MDSISIFKVHNLNHFCDFVDSVYEWDDQSAQVFGEPDLRFFFQNVSRVKLFQFWEVVTEERGVVRMSADVGVSFD